MSGTCRRLDRKKTTGSRKSKVKEWFKMQDIKPKKAACPTCRSTKVHKRKKAPGYYCYSCKVAFRDPLFNEHDTLKIHKAISRTPQVQIFAAIDMADSKRKADATQSRRT